MLEAGNKHRCADICLTTSYRRAHRHLVITALGNDRKEGIMAKIYLAFVDTPGVFASLIRCFLKQKYIHVVISLDSGLNEAYSFGRRNPLIPLISGFEKENKQQILRAFPSAEYMICELECTQEQKERICRTLRRDMEHRYQYHYAVASLPFILLGKAFYQKNHYTCSSYIARLLAENEIYISAKHFSLVTPKDFYEYPDKRVVFEGSLSEIVVQNDRWNYRRIGAAYEY